MINANKRYFEQHKSSEEEKPYIYRPFSKEKPEQVRDKSFATFSSLIRFDLLLLDNVSYSPQRHT